MKKFNEFELIGIGIALLLICIIFSLVGKYIFGLEGDYLSAAATLFAAVIAFILFNDWREEQEYQTKKEFIMKIRLIYDDLYDLNFDHIDSRGKLIFKLESGNYDSDFPFDCFNNFSIFKMKLDSLITKMLITLEEYEVISNQEKFIQKLDRDLELQQKNIHKAFKIISTQMDLKNMEPKDLARNFEEFNNVVNKVMGEIYGQVIFKLIEQLRPFT